MKLKYLLYTTVISCLIYFIGFAYIVHKPLSVGILQGYYEKKISYLRAIDCRKIILLAGSNGRFSHRCETIEEEIAVPCVNMSVIAGISLDYQFEKIKPFISSGDIVYLPFEFGVLSNTNKNLFYGAQLPYIVAYDHNYFSSMDC